MALETPFEGVGDAATDDAKPAPPIETFAEDGDEFDDFEGTLDVEGSGEFEEELEGDEGEVEGASDDGEGDSPPSGGASLSGATEEREPSPLEPPFPVPCLCVEMI